MLRDFVSAKSVAPAGFTGAAFLAMKTDGRLLLGQGLGVGENIHGMLH